MLYALMHKLVRSAATHGASADQILARAKACSIHPYLYAAIKQGTVSSADLGIDRARLDKQMLAFLIDQTAKIGLYHHTLKILTESLGDAHIVLKGALLGQILMGDERWRDTSDIDIWVSPEHRDDAVMRCQKLGYQVALEPHLWATNQIYLSHDRLIPVEIHWALAPAPWITPSFEEAFARSRIVKSSRGLDVRILGDDDLYVHLLVHAHQHYFAIKTLCDLAAASDKLAIPQALLETCHLHRLERFANAVMRDITTDTNTPSARLVRLWFDTMLTDSHRGTMIFAEGSDHWAPIGVAIRAASMLLMDNPSVALDAASQVILCGPHSIGRICHKPYNAFRKCLNKWRKST